MTVHVITRMPVDYIFLHLRIIIWLNVSCMWLWTWWYYLLNDKWWIWTNILIITLVLQFNWLTWEVASLSKFLCVHFVTRHLFFQLKLTSNLWLKNIKYAWLTFFLILALKRNNGSQLFYGILKHGMAIPIQWNSCLFTNATELHWISISSQCKFALSSGTKLRYVCYS